MRHRLFSVRPHALSPREKYLAELDRTHADLTCAYGRFDLLADPELIDSCIYEINSLEARYSYLLRTLKQLSVPTAAGDGEAEWT